jgi:hypothetical protein
MSLILAIEPDRRQVAQLIGIVRQVAGAELVLADTTERALESIGSRVPDLILVPALLSPQDDAALAAALRVIATAAHVQMLTIPTFASAKPRQKARGVLAAFRRSTKETLDGCAPAMFAEQISSYLQRASEEREAALAVDDYAEPMPADSLPASAQTFDEFLPATLENTDAAEAFSPPAYEEPPAPFEIAAAPDAPAELWMAADDPPQALGADEVGASLELAAPPVVDIVDVVDVVDVVDDEACAVALPGSTAAANPEPPPMALDEFVATLERVEPPPIVIGQTLAAIGVDDVDESVDIDIDLTTELDGAMPQTMATADQPIASAPALDEWLADFERADLPVIQEVHAEQWMVTSPVEAPADEEIEDDDNESGQVDIDLSIELDAVLHAEGPPERLEHDASLKPFQPVMPVERFEPFPLAAWQSWPHLEGTAAEAYQEASSADSDTVDGPTGSGLDHVAEFEAALQEAEPLERFEPVVPVQTCEPLPLAAWQSWPRLEGVMAEAYQEPIAPRKAVAKPEWVELMRSLREDIARRRAELTQPVQAAQAPHKPLRSRVEPLAQAAKPAPPSEPAAQKRPKRTRPIEDEWGLFDPEQCGFAALLDKLDEITVPPPGSQPRRQA